MGSVGRAVRLRTEFAGVSYLPGGTVRPFLEPGITTPETTRW
jgi:hypothetical protein